jgi:hypothetical protein
MKDPFRPKEDDEELLGYEYPYLSAIRPDIAFVVNLLYQDSTVLPPNGIGKEFNKFSNASKEQKTWDYSYKRRTT